MSEITSASYNQQDIKLMNRSTVLRLLCVHGMLSRTQLSSLTGMSRAAITNIVNEMLQRGIVSECDPADSKELRGRRPISLKILRCNRREHIPWKDKRRAVGFERDYPQDSCCATCRRNRGISYGKIIFDHRLSA